MALPFQSTLAKKRTHAVAIDLGSRSTKAVWVQRKGDEYELNQFAVLDAPTYDKNLSAALLGDHLKAVAHTLGYKQKSVILVVGVHDSLLRHAEMPMVPVPDMRLMLKYNSKSYLQQELPDHIFDCFVLPPRASAAAAEPAKNTKCRVLVAAAKRSLVDLLQEAAKAAALAPDEVTPNAVGAANAFELTQPEAFAKEIVALVDIGFRNTTITILLNGQISLSRVVAIGSDKLTKDLADFLGASYAEAEAKKLEMAEDVQPMMMNLLMPLGRELRASIDFFEKQEEKTVTQVYLTGGAARSNFMIETLQTEMMVPCQRLNPVGFLNLSLPPQQMGEVESLAPLFTAAVGSAVAALH